MKIIHFASSIRHVGRSRSKQHENIPALIFFCANGSNMKHVTLRSSSATNAGSGQASGKHSQLSLFPICLCCHPQFLTQFLYVPQLQSQRWTASELTCRLWSPYSMRRRYILFILYSFFFIYILFLFFAPFVVSPTAARPLQGFFHSVSFFFCAVCYV